MISNGHVWHGVPGIVPTLCHARPFYRDQDRVLLRVNVDTFSRIILIPNVEPPDQPHEPDPKANATGDEPNDVRTVQG